MKNPELYHRTTDILSEAFRNGTLAMTDCAACAVGTLVMKNCGYKHWMTNKWKDDRQKTIEPWWEELVWEGEKQEVKHPYIAKRQIQSTGYTIEELRRIEDAAMSYESEDNYYKAMMNVIKVLDDIHGNKCKMLSKNVKKKFKK